VYLTKLFPPLLKVFVGAVREPPLLNFIFSHWQRPPLILAGYWQEARIRVDIKFRKILLINCIEGKMYKRQKVGTWAAPRSGEFRSGIAKAKRIRGS
jgi:hypothetical protein